MILRFTELSIPSSTHTMSAVQKLHELERVIDAFTPVPVEAPVLEELWETLERDGIVVLENVFSEAVIDALKNAYQVAFDHVQHIIQTGTLTPEETTWITEFDEDKRYLKKLTYVVDNVKNINLGGGRFDYQWGFDYGIFASPKFIFPSPVDQLIKRGLVDDFHRISGSLPLEPQSPEPGDWHRDTLSLFHPPSMDLTFPPWYYTTLIPLDDVTVSNGATQFILGSHKHSFAESQTLPTIQIELKRGSVVLFDGRIYHRGMPNHTDNTRVVLYTSYIKNWYRSYFKNKDPSLDL